MLSRLVARRLRQVSLRPINYRASSSIPTTVETDELGIPLKPTWSVKELLSSYPPPSLSPDTLEKLHQLSALTPPPVDSKEFETLRGELCELIRMVEAVRTIDVPKDENEGIPDGRIWPSEQGMTFEDDDVIIAASEEHPGGRELLEHADRTEDGFYVVDSARKR